MRTRFLLIIVTLFAACFVAPDDHNLGSAPSGGALGGNSGGTGGGSGAGGGGTASYERCVQLLGYELLCTTVFPVVCGGVKCAVDEVCCQTTGACVMRGSSACPKPPTNDLNGLAACGSNADCRSDEYCVPDDYRLDSSGPQLARCIGLSGHCQPLANCAYCSAPGSSRCQVCGCDGVTYASPQVACVAGVSAPNPGPCGVAGLDQLRTDGGAYTVSCGTSAECPAGASCCFRTGRCFDASEPWRCELQPNGSILNCATHEECQFGGGGGSGTETPTRYCAADGCVGPGLCSTRWPASSCGGEVQPVCGCDGVTYVNECWARSAGARVATSGACP